MQLLYISFEYQSADLLTWTDCTTCAKPLTPWGWTQVGATSASSIKSVYWLTEMNYVFPLFPSVVSSSSWDRVYWLGWIGWFQVEGSTSLQLKSTLHLRQGIKNLQHHCATIVVNDCCVQWCNNSCATIVVSHCTTIIEHLQHGPPWCNNNCQKSSSK